MARDDGKYIQLMDLYKNERFKNPQEAVLYLEAAIKLRELGNVSEDAISGARYL
jgi:hypothetical protein